MCMKTVVYGGECAPVKRGWHAKSAGVYPSNSLKSKSAFVFNLAPKSYIFLDDVYRLQIKMVLVSIRLAPLEKSLNKETQSVYLAPSITPPLFWFRLPRKK